MDYPKTAQAVLEGLGGAENVNYFTHCATRLRVTLNDRSKVSKTALESTPGVLSVIEQSGQTQVVLGNEVEGVYNAMAKLPGMEKDGGKAAGTVADDADDAPKANVITRMFDVLSDSFRPILWALLGSSMILTLIVFLQLIGVFGHYTNFAGQVVNVDIVNGPKLGDPAKNAALLDEWKKQFPIWFVIMAASLSVLNFLPIMIGATAAKRLGANMWVGAAIPAALMTGTFTGLSSIADANGMIPLFHIGSFTVPLYVFNYGGQIFPPLFAVALLAPLERFLKRVLPTMLHMVFVPMLSLLIMVPLTALVIGPFGVNLGLGISHLFQWLNGVSPALVGVVIAGSYLFMVPLGLHWPLNAIMISNLSTLGYDFIQSPMAAYNFAVFGTVTGVAIRAKRNKELRQVATGAAVSGLLGGISEPSLYGVVLRYKRVFPLILVPAMIGGGLISALGVKAYAFTFNSLLAIPAQQPVPLYTLGIAVAFFGAMTAVLIFGYESKDQRTERLAAESETRVPSAVGAGTAAGATAAGAASADAAQSPSSSRSQVPGSSAVAAPAVPAGTELAVTSPLAGKAVEISEIPDALFASGKLGEGVGIVPSGSEVVAPSAGVVSAIPASKHALGLKLDNGIEMLIHVGIDTVNLKGEGFDVKVAKGDRFETGQTLMVFDRAVIDRAGYSMVTPVLVTNAKKFESVTGHPAEHAGTASKVITAVTK